MSKIGRLPISLPAEVSVKIGDGKVLVKGKLGELTVAVPPQIKVVQDGTRLIVSRADDSNSAKALHGLIRSLVNNSVVGVAAGFTKTLEITGVGYRAELKGDKLVLHIGLSHPVEVGVTEGVTVKQDKNQLIFSGIDKQKVGHLAALVRSRKKPEPYKGKGIKYIDEVVKRKAGKTAKTAA
ncbi:MAG: 50S ribosomal protein L6 [bacterium]